MEYTVVGLYRGANLEQFTHDCVCDFECFEFCSVK